MSSRHAAPRTRRPDMDGWIEFHRIVAAPISVFVVGLVGCGGGESGGGFVDEEVGTSFRTVGDTTVARTTGLDRERFRAGLVEELSVGSLEGPPEQIFGNIAEVGALPDGGAYVWDSQARELRHYGPDGEFVRLIGRAGEGPGEYGNLDDLAILPDGRAVANDPRNHRVSFLATDGEFETSVPGRDVSIGGSGVGMSAAPDGSGAWVRSSGFTDERRRARRDLFVHHGRDGSVDTLVVPDLGLESSEVLLQHPDAGIRMLLRIPLMPEVVWAVGPDGEEYSARSDVYRIDVSREGGSVLRLEADAAPVAVLPEEREYFRNLHIENARNLDPGWDWEGPDVPATKPYVKELYLGGRGRLWVQVHARGITREREDRRSGEMETYWTEPTVFDVFEADGTYLGSVAPPEDTRLATFRGDTVWAVHRDELGVSYLKRLRVEWPEIG